MPRHMILCIPTRWVQNFDQLPVQNLYRRVHDYFVARGVRVRISGRKWRAYRKPQNANDLCLVHNGDAVGKNALNLAEAYVFPYWQLEADGILGNSAIGRKTYDPTQKSPEAEAFFATLQQRRVAARASRLDQPEAVTKLPKNCLAVFLQKDSWLTDRCSLPHSGDMLQAVADGAGGRPIVVKHHPRGANPKDVETLEKLRAAGADITVTEANLHDILRACVASVSISSACSFEGFLHEKPAILFGKSDFLHIAHAYDPAAGFATTLAEALAQDIDYAAYVHWYLAENCLNPEAEDFIPRLLVRIADLGYDVAKLGLNS